MTWNQPIVIDLTSEPDEVGDHPRPPRKRVKRDTPIVFTTTTTTTYTSTPTPARDITKSDAFLGLLARPLAAPSLDSSRQPPAPPPTSTTVSSPPAAAAAAVWHSLPAEAPVAPVSGTPQPYYDQNHVPIYASSSSVLTQPPPTTGIGRLIRLSLPASTAASSSPRQRRPNAASSNNTPTTGRPRGRQRTAGIYPSLGSSNRIAISYAVTDGTNAHTRTRGLGRINSHGRNNESQQYTDWYELSRRPYLTIPERQAIQIGARFSRDSVSRPGIYHVDVSTREETFLGQGLPTLRGREDIYGYRHDARLKDGHGRGTALALVNNTGKPSLDEARRAGRVSDLLFARELEGNRGMRNLRSHNNFREEFSQAREDDLEVVEAYGGAPGDIVTISWLDNDTYICGTTGHSDAHNQQYNRAGNLLLGTAGNLKALPDHRIPLPVVDSGVNATAAMRALSDDWLYASVVSSSFCKERNLAFTSSFDKTVKVWKVNFPQHYNPLVPVSMDLQGTWHHDGNVNFVVASGDGKHVATGADVPFNAIRIYDLDPDATGMLRDSSNASNTPFTEVTCARALDMNGNHTDKWVYVPATMQWGRSPESQHLLLVGYSPRALPGYTDLDIPLEKRNTGETILWDHRTKTKIHITTAQSQNVFEVIWHPSQACFCVATSPCNVASDSNIGIQIRIFMPGKNYWSENKCLDCPARDINELAIFPNSAAYSYIAAAGADGIVYVWDSAFDDRPIHQLPHGPAMEDLQGERGDRGFDDTGVKFVAWGSTPDRLYSGSSDGVIKVWNIRNQQKPFVRNLCEATGAASCGTFSPDFTKLAIGDSSGVLRILSLDEPPAPRQTRQRTRTRQPKEIIRHPSPPPPGRFHKETAIDTSKELVDSGSIVIHPDRLIGACQGPNYSSLSLYRRDAHYNYDPDRPLLAEFDPCRRKMHHETLETRPESSALARFVGNTRRPTGRERATHDASQLDDINLYSLAPEVQEELERDGVDFEQEDLAFDFDYEEDDWYNETAKIASSF